MKKCTKCGVEKEDYDFSKSKNSKDGLLYLCKQCRKQYRSNPEEFNKKHAKVIPKGKKWCNRCKEFKNYDEFSKSSSTSTGLCAYCKNCVNNDSKKHYTTNYDREYAKRKNYYSDNKEKEALRTKKYRENHPEEYKLRHKKERQNFANYNKNYNKLTIEEEPILAEDGVNLEVRCKHCREYFKPTNMQIQNRVRSLNNLNKGDSFIYCSEKCKNSCLIYNILETEYLPIPILNKDDFPYTKRELEVWSETVKANNESGLCEVCGINAGNIAHHELPKKTHPQYALDLSNGIAVCAECHNKLHTGECSTGRLASIPCKLK